MENKFDHIEESVRKAFEGLELPVSDTDWSRISAGLENAGSKKGFVFWPAISAKKRRNGLLILGLLALTSAGFIWWWSNKSATEAIHTENSAVVNNNKENQSVQRQEPEASGEASMDRNVTGMESAGDMPSEALSGPEKAKPQSTVPALPGGKQNTPAKATVTQPVGTKQIDPEPVSIANPAETAPAEVVETVPPSVVLPVAIVPQPDAQIPPDYGHLRGFGLRTLLSQLLLGKTLSQKLTPEVKYPLQKKPNGSYPLYVSLQTSYAPGATKAQGGSEEWKGFQWMNGSNPALDVRLDAGLALGTGDWKFTVGGAVEGNAVNSRSVDSIRILKARRFLPYYDQGGKLLYMLAVEWDTIYMKITNNPQRVWAEVPLGLYRSFDTKNDFKISVGITLNPGVMLGSNATIANPYVYRAGSDWSYNYGVENADTTSATISAKQFLNPVRLGNSVQLGIEKDMGTWNWGLQAQTRYYYTPVWKTGVPIKQNTIQYGINLRLGFKI